MSGPKVKVGSKNFWEGIWSLNRPSPAPASGQNKTPRNILIPSSKFEDLRVEDPSRKSFPPPTLNSARTFLLEGLAEKVSQLDLSTKQGQALLERIDTLRALGMDPQVDSHAWWEAVLQLDGGLRLLKGLEQLSFTEPSARRPEPSEWRCPPVVDWVRRRLVRGLQSGQPEVLHQARKQFEVLRDFAAFVAQKTQLALWKRQYHHPMVVQGLDADQLAYFCEVPEEVPAGMELLRPEDPCFFDPTPRKLLNDSDYVRTYFLKLIYDPQWARQLRQGEAVLYNHIAERLLFTEGGEAKTLAELPQVMARELQVLQAARYDEFVAELERRTRTEQPSKAKLEENRRLTLSSGAQWQRFQEIARAIRLLQGPDLSDDVDKAAAYKKLWQELLSASEDLAQALDDQKNRISEHPEWIPLIQKFGVDLDELQNPFGKYPDHPDRHEGGLFSNSATLTDFYDNGDKVGSVAQSEAEYQSDPKNMVRPTSDYLEGGYFRHIQQGLQDLQWKVVDGRLDYGAALKQAIPLLLHAARNHFVGNLGEWLALRQPQLTAATWFQQVDLSFTGKDPQTAMTEVTGRLEPFYRAQQESEIKQAIHAQIQSLKNVRKELLSARDSWFDPEYSPATAEGLILQYEALLANEVQSGQWDLAYAKYMRISAGGPQSETLANLESLQSFRLWKELGVQVASFLTGSWMVSGVRSLALLRGGAQILRAGSFGAILAEGSAAYGMHQLFSRAEMGASAPKKTFGEHFRDWAFFVAAVGVLGKAMAWRQKSLLRAYTRRTGLQLAGHEAEAYLAGRAGLKGFWRSPLENLISLGIEFSAWTGWNVVEANLRLALEGEFAPGQVLKQVFSVESLEHQALFLLGMKLGHWASRPLRAFGNEVLGRLVLGESRYAQWQSLQGRSRRLTESMGEYLEEVGRGKAADPLRRKDFFLEYTRINEARVKFLSELPEPLKDPSELEQAYQDLQEGDSLTGIGQLNLQVIDGNHYRTDGAGLRLLEKWGAELKEVDSDFYEWHLGSERLWLEVEGAKGPDALALAARAPRSLGHWWSEQFDTATARMDLLAGGGLAYQALSKVLENFRYRNQLSPREQQALRVTAFELAKLEGKLGELGKNVTRVDQVDSMKAVFYLQEKLFEFREFQKSPAAKELSFSGGPHQKLKTMLESKNGREEIGPVPEAAVPEHFVAELTGITHVAEVVSPPSEVVDYVFKLLGPERRNQLIVDFQLDGEAGFRSFLEQVLIQGASAQRRFSDKAGGFRLPVSPEQKGMTPTSLEDRNTLLGYYLVFLDSPKARQEAQRRYHPKQVMEREARRWDRILRSGGRLLRSLEAVEPSGSNANRVSSETLAAELHQFRNQISRITLKPYDFESPAAQAEVDAYAQTQTGGPVPKGAEAAVMNSLLHVGDLKRAYRLSSENAPTSQRIAVPRNALKDGLSELPPALVQSMKALKPESSPILHRQVVQQVATHLEGLGLKVRIEEVGSRDFHVVIVPQPGAKHWLGKMAFALWSRGAPGTQVVFSTLDRAHHRAFANAERLSLPWENLNAPHLTTGGGHEIRHYLREKSIESDTRRLLKLIALQEPEGAGVIELPPESAGRQKALPIRIRLVLSGTISEGETLWQQKVRQTYLQTQGHGVEELDAYGFEIRSLVQTMRRLDRLSRDPAMPLAHQAWAEITLRELGRQVEVLGKVYQELAAWDIPAMEQAVASLRDGSGILKSERSSRFTENRYLELPDGTRLYYHLEQIDGRQHKLGDFSKDPQAVGREFAEVLRDVRQGQERVNRLLEQARKLGGDSSPTLLPSDPKPTAEPPLAPGSHASKEDFMGDNRFHNRKAGYLAMKIKNELSTRNVFIPDHRIEEAVHEGIRHYKDNSNFRRNANSTEAQLEELEQDILTEFLSTRVEVAEPDMSGFDLNREIQILLAESMGEPVLIEWTPELREKARRIREFMEVQVLELYGFESFDQAYQDSIFWSEVLIPDVRREMTHIFAGRTNPQD